MGMQLLSVPQGQEVARGSGSEGGGAGLHLEVLGSGHVVRRAARHGLRCWPWCGRICQQARRQGERSLARIGHRSDHTCAIQ